MEGGFMSWLLNVLIAIDQLGNAITGGNPDNTISARAAYFAKFSNSKFKKFWIIIEKIIDKTFEPVDGKGHCLKSFHHEKGHKFGEGSDIARGILAIVVVFACLLLVIPLHILGFLFKKKEG
jgi:hypothetical protein